MLVRQRKKGGKKERKGKKQKAWCQRYLETQNMPEGVHGKSKTKTFHEGLQEAAKRL